MTSPVSERSPSEDPSLPPEASSVARRGPIYQTETTGNYWADVREAFKVRHHRLLSLPPPRPPSFFSPYSVFMLSVY
jgi:hypothetical protein